MKYFFIFFTAIFSLSSITSTAQQNHFIYLQTDNKQPFYVKLQDKVLSSSAAGYLIIGKLPEGNYQLHIGFPNSEWVEQNIDVTVAKDAGFLLKNFGEKGWGLFNLQSNEVNMAGGYGKKEEKVEKTIEKDPFSTMLANVINDSTLLEKDVVKEEIKKQQPVPVKEEPVITPPVISPDSATAGTAVLISKVKRTLRKKTTKGTELVYVDEFGNNRDTIRIFIPIETEIKETPPHKDVALNADTSISKGTDIIKPAVTIPVDTSSQKKDEIVTTEQKIVSNPNAGETKGEIKQEKPPVVNDEKTVAVEKDKPAAKEYRFIEDKKEKSPVTKSVMINSDCKAQAGDDDFLKLRKKMAAETTDENMIKVARKAFKSKCYSTELIKNLGLLFLKDDGKYMFFDAAYPFVSDSDQFSTLQSQLTDSYYITRFNAMLRK